MRRIVIAGRAVAIHGNDIDTDRVIPARFLRCVTFEGLGDHLFEDDRKIAHDQGRRHPLNDSKHEGAEILLVNKNFGCGSSREHAPQAILRWGIRAIVGESFAQIFFGNCVALGLPCVMVNEATMGELMRLSEENASRVFAVNLENKTVRTGANEFDVEMEEGMRRQFLEGCWDSMTELISARDQIEATAAHLPYFNSWR
ncbi:3-isopropylmalate dehydratase small subunit [bacterium]|nr:3-isopropylmalate dehydratase small subunit [bacterium]